MFLSKSTEYAIRAMVFIKSRMDKQPYIGFREVAKEIGAPEPFTGKVLQSLVRKGFLNSSKGPGGGFFLDVQKGSVSLIKIIEDLEGAVFFSKCGLGLKNCSATNPCPIHEKYVPIRQEFEKMMSSESISSLAEKIKNGKAVISNPY